MLAVTTVHSRVLPYPLGRSRATLTYKLDRSAKLTESRCVVRSCSRRNDETSPRTDRLRHSAIAPDSECVDVPRQPRIHIQGARDSP